MFQALKAECLIFLNGYTVAIAHEVSWLFIISMIKLGDVSYKEMKSLRSLITQF